MCAWMIDPRIGDVWKPEKSKLVLVADSTRNRMTVYIDPGAPDAWKKEPYRGVLQTMAAQGLAHGGQVILMNVGRASLLLPDGLHELGALAGDTVIEVAHTKGPAGDSYAVTVRPPAGFPSH